MPSYILRKLEPDFWHAVKTKALSEHKTIDQIIKELLVTWLKRL